MRPIRLVAHTHWDREWYLTFEEFRDKLVTTLDLVLDLLRDDPRWSHFHLDGQTAMIDDYLSVCPEREPEIKDHVSRGRLSCGPWVSLVDEFLVSGESIIRNLQDGIERGEDLGGVTQVAYLPDQFGHIGQMPQILRRAGLDRTIVWRGVPYEITGSGFAWRAPDGSQVKAFYLPWGYAQGQRIETEPDAFLARLHKEVERSTPWLEPDEPMLLMTGDDHDPPAPNLPDLIEHAREAGVDVQLTSLARFLDGMKAADRSWTGELRSAARAPLLPNTYSVRPRQKVERARAEHLLERYAQPLAALVDGIDWPAEELHRAWAQLHLNGAHDSVCGCSSDDVAAAVDSRTAFATSVGRRISSRALERLAGLMHDQGTLVFNPSPFERDGVPGLGWRVAKEPATRSTPVRPAVRDGWFLYELGDTEVALKLVDQADLGDLYTFEADGDPIEPDELSVRDDVARIHFAGCSAALRAKIDPGDDFGRLDVEIDNRAPDHRLQLIVRTEGSVTRTRAGAPFEIVERPALGEGGDTEPTVRHWPARGFVSAGGAGLLHAGVFEYEVVPEGLAVTLIRCVGTISRISLAARASMAGPDVATPGAQLPGRTDLHFGLLESGADPLRAWERFALPLITAPARGGGNLPAGGRLLEIDTPALSTVLRRGRQTVVRVWNPGSEQCQVNVGGAPHRLDPHAIETLALGSGEAVQLLDS